MLVEREVSACGVLKRSGLGVLYRLKQNPFEVLTGRLADLLGRPLSSQISDAWLSRCNVVRGSVPDNIPAPRLL